MLFLASYVFTFITAMRDETSVATNLTVIQ